MANHNYWLVGATWQEDDFTGDKYSDFTQNGIWMLGYKKQHKPQLYALAQQIKIGDRIAIKHNQGPPSEPIDILNTGIVTGVINNIDRVTYVVKWFNTQISNIESRGCFRSVNGPFQKNDQYRDWLNQIFSL